MDVLGGDIHGYNFFISGTQYVPSIILHHGLALKAVHQLQKGMLFYNKDLSIPRGYSDDDPYGDLYRRKNLLLTAEYHFPILFTDTGIGLYSYHSDLVKGSVFVDCGAGWDDGFHWHSWRHKARTTVGATLSNRCVLLAVLPIEIGITAGYKTREDEGFSYFFLRFEM
jgi:hypothetical protein